MNASPNFSICLRPSRKNVLAALAVFLTAAAFFVLEWPLVAEENESGEKTVYWWYILTFGGLSLAAAALCLIEIHMPPGIRQKLGWALVLTLPVGFFVAVDVINGTRIWQFSSQRCVANYLCYLLVFILAYAITRRAWAAAAIGGAVCMTFGIANYFVVQFRGQPILPWDFQSFATALTVSGGYEYQPTRKMGVAAMCYIGSVIISAKLAPQEGIETSGRFRITERLTALGVSAALALALFPMDLLSDMGISVWTWNQKTSSEITGIAAGFVANVQFMMVDEPEGYSTAKARALAEEIGSIQPPAPIGQPGKKPTIIAIMNESMTDFGQFNTLKFSPDNLPYLHSLQQSGQMVWGTAYSSVYGGNTCNSEYEFLSGNTMAFLPTGSKPYQQYIDSPQTALPSILKSYGYHCVAVHPGNRDAWQRMDAYPHLGFDEFVDATIFDVRRTFEHRLTSDYSCYEQVIYEYERWRRTPLFIFNVTIQNHGGYEDPNYRARVRVSGAAGQWPQAEQYLSLTKSSDEALEYLLDYFEARPDPVVILFFGDHWPKLEEEFNQALLESYDRVVDQYRVPFFIWANYPLEGEKIEAVSLNYLSGLLLRAAGLEGSPYTNYLEQLRQNLPVVTDIGTMNNEGDFFLAGDSLPSPIKDWLNEYAILQYNNSFGGDGKVYSAFQGKGIQRAA